VARAIAFNLNLCDGYAPAPLGPVTPSADVQLLPAYDALNTHGKDALYARLTWCATPPPSRALRNKPCNVTALIVADGEFWAWTGWWDAAAWLAREAEAGSGGRANMIPAPLASNCSGAAAGWA
jgi:hypothetical protein